MVKRITKVKYKCGKCSRMYDTEESAIACEMLHGYVELELTYQFSNGLWEMLEFRPSGTWWLGHDEPVMEMIDGSGHGEGRLTWSVCVPKEKKDDGMASLRAAARKWFEERIVEIDKASESEDESSKENQDEGRS